MEWIEIIAAIISIVTGVVAIAGAIQATRKRRKLSSAPAGSEKDSVAERFILLFEAHGVHQNQIPDFFGHGLTLADVSSPETLLCKLSPNLLSEAAELFAVNLEWLQGAIGSPYPTHHFYKRPSDFESFIDELTRSGKMLDGYIFTAKLSAGSSDVYDAAIVITEVIGQVNDRSVYRIHICNGWVFRYWKCRGYLAACIAIAWRKGAHLIGKEVDLDWLIQFGEGERLISYDYETGYLKFPARSTWHADEFVDSPNKYLIGVDPEQDKFGLKSALQLWLDLEADGHIRMYYDSSHDSMKRAFIKALSEI